MNKNSFDLLILGSGSAAFAAAIKASSLGAKVGMSERDIIGGTCVNRGCIPSKNLIRAAEVYHNSVYSGYRGLECRGRKTNFRLLIKEKDSLVEKPRRKKYTDIAHADPNISILKGKGEFISSKKVRVNGEAVPADKFIVTTGSSPRVLDFPGLKEAGYLTSREAFELHELPESIAIMGGGFIAVELGQMFQRLGSTVTIIERDQQILSGLDEEVAAVLNGYLVEEGVQIKTGFTLRSVKGENGKGVVIAGAGEDGESEIRSQYLLLASGRVPNSEDLGLEKAGIEMDKNGYIKVDKQMRTTSPNVWAAGDVTGPPMGTPVSAREGIIAAENALKGTAKEMDYSAIPRAVFTDPEVASVGLTVEEARQKGYKVKANCLHMTEVPKAAAIFDTRGLIKMVIDEESGKILGVHLATNRGADIIHEAALAVKFGLTIDDLIDTIHVYPTMSEALRMAAQSFTRDVSKLSCCAE